MGDVVKGPWPEREDVKALTVLADNTFVKYVRWNGLLLTHDEYTRLVGIKEVPKCPE